MCNILLNLLGGFFSLKHPPKPAFQKTPLATLNDDYHLNLALFHLTHTRARVHTHTHTKLAI